MRLIAHRGITYKHLENSKEAIMEAINSSLTAGVEFDVRMTKDKQMVIIHDDFPLHSFKCPYPISQMTLKEIKKLKYKHYRISTLEEVLSLISSDKIMMIEMKVDNDYIEYVNHFNECLRQYSLNYYVCSFNNKALMYFHHLNNKLKVGLITSSFIQKVPEYVNFLSLKYTTINSKHINTLMQKVENLFVWTVDECILINPGIGIITDNPLLLSKCNKKEV